MNNLNNLGLLTRVGGSAKIALFNWESFLKMAERKQSVDLVCDIAELISRHGEGERRDILQSVVESVARHMRADVCSIYVFEEERGELVLRATRGLSADAVGQVRLRLGEGITGRAVKELRPICAGRAEQAEEYRFFPGIREEDYEAFLAVPILRGLRRVGALVVQSREPDFFSGNDIKALRAIAAQLATTIENVQLLEKARGTVADRVAPAAGSEGQRLLRGRGASPGTACGKALMLAAAAGETCPLPDPDAPPPTVEDFEAALRKTIRQLDDLQRKTGEQLADVAVLIFSAHQLILEDERFSGRIKELIREGVPALKAIATVVDDYVETFSRSKMPLIREKVLDVKDLGNRLVRNLLNREEEACDYRGQVLVAHELLPSDILKLSAENMEGFIVSSGVTSHNAIICKSLGIPMVALSREDADAIADGEDLLVDATQGIVYVRPGEAVLEKYDRLERARAALRDAEAVKEQTFTRCGERVRILANINLLSDLEPARRFKAEGVGLYRSEFPFIVRNDFPDEEEQYFIYRKIVEQMEGRSVTFRTLDIGGDKMLSYYSHVNEANPFLGMRAIRFSLRNRDIFAQQLRAFLRAGAGAPTRIMFPFISSVDDFVAARGIVHECMDELEADGLPFERETPLGLMVELPSAVEVIDELAREADFLSIGSNDLIQYMLAVDRTNEQVSGLYQSHNPAILRVVDRVVSAARRHGRDVSLCGELASDPRMLPFLVGVGLRKFSIDIASAPAVQRAVEGIGVAEAEEIARAMLRFGRISEVEAFLAQRLKDTG